jgi:hypothetical protein
VKVEDEQVLEAAKTDLETALKDNDDAYSAAKKQELRAEMDRIDAMLDSIDRIHHIREMVSELPDAGTVRPDDLDVEEKLLQVLEAVDALGENEQAQAAVEETLEAIRAALVDYRFLDGHDQVWSEEHRDEEDNHVTADFHLNGAVSKFIRVLVNGQEVDPAYYTVRQGSTIIHLKPEFLKTLDAGEHALTVEYTDGSVDGTFYVEESAGFAWLWILLAVVALAGGGSAGFFYFKKKGIL